MPIDTMTHKPSVSKPASPARPFGVARGTNAPRPNINLASNSRAVALNVLQDITRQDAYAGLVLDKRLTDSGMSERDKALTTRMVYGVIENRMRLDYTIDALLRDPDNIEPLTRDIMRLGAYQLIFMDRVPDHAATYETVSVAKALPSAAPFAGLINATLHRLIETRRSVSLPKEPIENLSIRASWPKWIVEKLIDTYGIETATQVVLVRGDQKQTHVVANNARVSNEELETRMTKAGWKFEKGKLPNSYLVFDAGSVAAHPLFRGGFLSVVGRSSAIAAEAVQAKPGMRILDACAAPGGKTMLLAQKMNGTGRVVAWDIHEHRVELIRAQIARLNIENVRPVIRDASVPYADGESTFDAVLVDAPCSGLGVSKDKPDARYRLTPEGLGELVIKQRAILENCAKQVKIGGALIYSTCTILREENEAQVEAFLHTHNNFRTDRTPICGIEPGEFGTLLLPHRDDCEGFFFARMIRER